MGFQHISRERVITICAAARVSRMANTKKRRGDRDHWEQFIFDRVTMEPMSGCWIWLLATDSKGYGNTAIAQDGASRFRSLKAHRLSYEVFAGEIPAGLQLDHRCRNTSCVNPSHLEPVTNRTNVLRGISPPAVNIKKTHCISGHPLSGSNLKIRADGNRDCRECHKIASREWMRRKLAKIKARGRG